MLVGILVGLVVGPSRGPHCLQDPICLATAHLPRSALDKCRRSFITTVGAYIGTKHMPWEIRDKESLEAIQDCWNHIYKSSRPAAHIMAHNFRIQ